MTSPNLNFLVDLLWVLNYITHPKHLPRCLPWGKCSIKVEYYHVTSLIIEEPQPVFPWRRQWSWPLSKTFCRVFSVYFRLVFPPYSYSDMKISLTLTFYLLKSWPKTSFLFSHHICHLSYNHASLGPCKSSDLSWDSPSFILTPSLPQVKNLSCDSPPQVGCHSPQSVLVPHEAPLAWMSKPNAVLP